MFVLHFILCKKQGDSAIFLTVWFCIVKVFFNIKKYLISISESSEKNT